ncbi:MerR family transcriptional regulator [Streptomyces sp. NPDC048507]|uniref:MerR family transcriptional regulator n=1 Tax=Streptomyces sp. NPDC048507 TaxID=3365560 RepID=UPI00371222D9
MDERTMRTVEVAGESGYSVQQVRDLERLGVIPPAARSANGYRSYTAVHVHALRAYRGLAAAAGPVGARRMLAGLRGGTLAEAAAAVGGVHVRLAREREEALRALAAVHAIRAEPGARPADGDGDGDRDRDDGDAMTITELAGALGVRASALRFWEQEGLVHPERVTSLRARRYGPPAVAAARIVAALRSCGYGVPAVREVMGSLAGPGGLTRTEQVLGRRLEQIAARTVALLHAGTDLAVVVTAAGEPGVG